MTELELVWLAGLLEGEGFFGLKKYHYGVSAPCIQLRMTDLDVVEKAMHLMGLKTYYAEKKVQEGHKTAYTIIAKGTRAAELMRLLHPHLGERRRAKIDEVMAGIADGSVRARGFIV